MVSILVEFSADEMKRITARAQELGYDNPGDYILALAEQDMREHEEESPQDGENEQD